MISIHEEKLKKSKLYVIKESKVEPKTRTGWQIFNLNKPILYGLRFMVNKDMTLNLTVRRVRALLTDSFIRGACF